MGAPEIVLVRLIIGERPAALLMEECLHVESLLSNGKKSQMLVNATKNVLNVGNVKHGAILQVMVVVKAIATYMRKLLG